MALLSLIFFFADDLLFFAKADQDNCHAIKEVLEVFYKKFGQTVSEAKSRVYFSPNVNFDLRYNLADIFGFRATPNLGKYLGFPLKHSGSGGQNFGFVLDRVKKKLAGWKANLLSMSGRMVLI